jgi:glycosyltransferase involved in cell wall biosynthesis
MTAVLASTDPICRSATDESIDGKSLVVFSDDWGRHPSSCQHLVRHLLDDFRVTWINTIGTRRPRLDLATIRRGCEKLMQWGRRRKRAFADHRSAPQVHSPRMWPSFHWPWERRFNRVLLSRFLTQNVPQRTGIILTTIPIVADLIEVFPAAHWVYYCVDDFSQWPGLDGRALQAMEMDLIDRADLIIAAGDNLAARIRDRGRKPTIIKHGVDIDHWRASRNVPIELEKLDLLQRPIALFWGLIDRRLDTNWLRALSDYMPRGSIVLVGPQQDPDRALSSIRRVHFTGPVSYEQLPSVAALADVLIMPYADLPVTRAMQPLKLKEYLATGKPVVVRDLPATREWDDCLDAPSNAGAFAAAVQRRFQQGVPADQLIARKRLVEESWQSKARTLSDLLLGRPAEASAPPDELSYATQPSTQLLPLLPR